MHCYNLQGARELPPDGSDNILNIPQQGVAAGRPGSLCNGHRSVQSRLCIDVGPCMFGHREFGVSPGSSVAASVSRALGVQH